MSIQDIDWDELARQVRDAFGDAVKKLESTIGPVRHRLDENRTDVYPLASFLSFEPVDVKDEDVVVEVLFQEREFGLTASADLLRESGGLLDEVPEIKIDPHCSLTGIRQKIGSFLDSVRTLILGNAPVIRSLVEPSSQLPHERSRSTHAKKTGTKKTVVNKAGAKKGSTKKATATKPAAKKTAAKKAGIKKAVAKAAKKTAVKKEAKKRTAR